MFDFFNSMTSKNEKYSEDCLMAKVEDCNSTWWWLEWLYS